MESVLDRLERFAGVLLFERWHSGQSKLAMAR